jgi:hypothetical protein
MTARPHRSPAVASALVVLTVLAAAPAASAHHSAAAYDMAQTVSLDGVVTRYEWKNPHVYIWLAAPGADGRTVEWEVEGQPPAVLRRIGWAHDTFKAGDRLQATGNPARNAQRNGLLLTSMKRADATVYDAATLPATLTTAAATPSAGAAGIAGVWVTLLDMAAMQSYLAPARRVPLTEAGVAARNAFDEATMSPGLRCIPPPAPAFMFVPDVKRITVEGGTIRIEGEFAAGERVIHLADVTAGSAIPQRSAARTPPVQGNSVGRWEGATLVVETTDFAPHAQGIGFRVPSSPQKRLVERLTLDADGKGLSYAFELADPEMLTGPVTGEGRWVFSPDVAFAPVACDLENAQRFTR